jgi:hypothetical protein
MGGKDEMRHLRLKALAGAVLFAIALSASANASSLREGSTTKANVTGSLPGQVLWTDYWTGTQTFCFGGTDDCIRLRLGDTILRVVNPNGGANGNLAGSKPQTVCAMVYVFDDDQEMGECCGCPLSSAQLATFSVEHNLTSNWGLSGGTEGGAHNNGAIAVVAASPNATSPTACAGQSGACNGGCDPTNLPGYVVTIQNNLLASRTLSKRKDSGSVAAIAEIPFNDDGGGDPVNLTYLQNQCGALVGNGTEGGICTCPAE